MSSQSHIRLPRRRRRRHALARRGRRRLEGGRHRAAARDGPDRPRRLREERGAQDRGLLQALPRRPDARAGGLLAPVRDPGRLGDADAALPAHARGPDRGRDADGGDRRASARTSRPGSSLAQAMERQPKVFDRLFRSMVRSGEQSGRLEEALERVAYQLEKLDALRRQIRSAMMYPAFVFVLGAGGDGRRRRLHRSGLRRRLRGDRRRHPRRERRAAVPDPDQRRDLRCADRLLVRDLPVLVAAGRRLLPVEEDRPRTALLGPDQAADPVPDRRRRPQGRAGPLVAHLLPAPSPRACRCCSRSRSPARPRATR